jgi:hypothetical protein
MHAQCYLMRAQCDLMHYNTAKSRVQDCTDMIATWNTWSRSRPRRSIINNQFTMIWEGSVRSTEGTPPYMLRGNMRGTSVEEHSACTAQSCGGPSMQDISHWYKLEAWQAALSALGTTVYAT